MPDGRSRYSERTLASMRRTRRRQQADLTLEIRLNGEPQAGETFEFVVSSKRRLTSVTAYIGQSRVCGVRSVEAPHTQQLSISPDAAGQIVRMRAVDVIGNNIEERRTVSAPLK
jgi:hypothetical protein